MRSKYHFLNPVRFSTEALPVPLTFHNDTSKPYPSYRPSKQDCLTFHCRQAITCTPLPHTNNAALPLSTGRNGIERLGDGIGRLGTRSRGRHGVMTAASSRAEERDDGFGQGQCKEGPDSGHLARPLPHCLYPPSPHPPIPQLTPAPTTPTTQPPPHILTPPPQKKKYPCAIATLPAGSAAHTFPSASTTYVSGSTRMRGMVSLNFISLFPMRRQFFTPSTRWRRL